jgi:2-succinyl-6-hydroxy-2,4-cyclohexadiene-1-carboxylate synthase
VTPLVLLHGFLGCGEDWHALIEALGSDRPTLAPDLPGHGPAPPPIEPGPTSFDRAVAWVAERIEATLEPPVDVLGYSMGGRLALGLLAARPDLLRRAVVVGGSAGIDSEIERRTRKRADDFGARALEREPFAAWLDAWYAQPLFDALRRHPDFPAIRARRLRGRPRALALALRALSPGVQPPLRHRLSQSAVPLLLIAGSEDAKYAELGRDLAASNPSFRDVVVPRAGHAPHLETPDAFLAAVREFLDGP